MKKNILFISIIAFVLLAQNLLFAADQKKVISFEEQHKDKNAIFLFFNVDIKVNEDCSYVSKVYKKYKILKEEAKQLGEIQLGYERGRDKITVEQAHSITSDGKKHRYSKIQDLKNYEGYPIYSDSMVKVITLPEVNVGTTIEYQTTRVSKGFSMENAFWYLFNFDFDTPAREINFTITWPKKLKVQYKAFNLDYKPKITENGSRMTYSWHLENIYKSSESEDYLPPPTLESVGSVAEFSSVKNWSDISNWYYSLIQKNLKINCPIEEVAKKVIKDKTTIKDKVRAILEYIQDNFRYVSMSFGDNSLVPHSTDSVFQNKYGDCKDLSLLCMAMLKVAGIKANIALFRDEFSINDPKYDLPIPSLFGHVLLLVEDPKEGDFYIDPLLDGCDINQYPLYYQGAYTFIITENGGRFSRFPIFGEKECYTKSERKITISQDGSALFESEMIWDLGSSVEQRQKMKAMNKEQKDKFYEALDEYLASGGELLERRIEDLDQKYGLIQTRSKLKRKDAYQISDGMIIIDVAGYNRNTDFLAKERKNPIFYPGNSLSEEITTYIIPKGFRVTYMPKNLNLEIGFFNMKREYIKKGNEIVIKETTRYKRLQLPKESYGGIKDFFDQLPNKSKQRIILRKVKPWWQGIKDIVVRFRRK